VRRLPEHWIDTAAEKYLPSGMATEAAGAVDAVYRADWGRIVATLIRIVGDFDLAEESAQDAFAVAVEAWQADGIPEFPRAWIIQTARRKAIDRIRRRRRQEAMIESYAASGLNRTIDDPDYDASEIPDDRLRLIFTCCHPSLALEAQVALTLRALGGLETDEIARAFLVPPATMAQRLVRAKRKIRDAGIPYVVPDTTDMPARLDAVLTVIYLVFNEGYAPTRGAPLVRTALCAEAIRLGRLVRTLMAPAPPAEATALLALMLLHDSRREARLDERGDLVVLEEQDRQRWDQGDRRSATARRGSASRRSGSVFSASGSRGAALSGEAAGGHGLAPDCPALRCPRASAAIADRVVEPRRCRRNGRGAAKGARVDRRARRHRRSRRVPPAACGARRPAAPSRIGDRRRGELLTRARARH